MAQLKTPEEYEAMATEAEAAGVAAAAALEEALAAPKQIPREIERLRGIVASAPRSAAICRDLATMLRHR